MSFAEELFDQLRPLAYAEAQEDDALWKYCQAVAAPWEQVYELVRDTPAGQPGWSTLLSPVSAPEEFLPWLHMLVGVSLIVGESPSDLRARMLSTAGYRRGTLRLINETITNLGATIFLVQERYTTPWNIRVLFTAAEDSAVLQAAVRNIIPAGIAVTFALWSGLLYDNIDPPAYATYTALAAGFSSYDDIQL